MNNAYSYLRFVAYKNIGRWDIKQYLIKSFSAHFNVVELGHYIQEESTKYNINDKSKEYGILGVNNQTGIFDAYMENGGKINQKYKKMEQGWIAYNPYRINVGSIGIKREIHHYDYISPAYVVFSCKNGLLPEFLFMLMKTATFNKIIRDNTTGSVRQNLSFSVLSKLQIPLPLLSEQQALVDAYNQRLKQAQELEQLISEGGQNIGKIVNDGIGLKKPNEKKKNNTHSLLQLINYKETLTRWDPFNVKSAIISKYPICLLKDLITSIGTGTTPSTAHKEYFNGDIKFYTPADIGKDMYLGCAERTLAQPAVDDRKARLFTKGQLLFVGIGSTVGKVGIVTDDIVSANQQITGFAVNQKLANPEYVYCYLDSNKDISTAERTKTTIPVVNQSKLESVSIPLPPLSVQQQIVDEVQAQRAQLATYRAQSAQLRKEANQVFEQSIFE